MDFITIPQAMAVWSAKGRSEGRTIDFVPTMGALHEGHLDLVRKAGTRGGKVVCSIFVNPLQFNNAEDLQHYPRQLDADRQVLEEAGCHALFAPEKEAIFAGFQPKNYDLGGLDAFWEGPSRPGHFQGVVNVVERLFHFVRPDRAYFGEKDRQQLAIIRHIARAEHWPERIIPCATIRGKDGVALSSRNARLDPLQRKQSAVLYRALSKVKEMAFQVSPQEATAAFHEILRTEPMVRLDHFGIADLDTLQPIAAWGDRTEAVALVAAFVGPVRLIDNITLTR